MARPRVSLCQRQLDHHGLELVLALSGGDAPPSAQEPARRIPAPRRVGGLDDCGAPRAHTPPVQSCVQASHKPAALHRRDRETAECETPPLCKHAAQVCPLNLGAELASASVPRDDASPHEQHPPGARARVRGAHAPHEQRASAQCPPGGQTLPKLAVLHLGSEVGGDCAELRGVGPGAQGQSHPAQPQLYAEPTGEHAHPSNAEPLAQGERDRAIQQSQGEAKGR